MEEKVSRIIIHDPHGNVTAERALSTEDRDQAIAGHNQSAEAHADIRQTLGDKIDDVQVDGTSVVTEDEQGRKIVNLHKDQLGKVDDVRVNGLSVLNENNEANINITASVDDSVGTPSVTPTIENGVVNLAFKNLKGEKGDDGATGGTGPQGATSVYDSTTQNFLTTLETTTGQDQTKTMTQKAITDEIMADRVWGEESVDSLSGTANQRYIYLNSDEEYAWKKGDANSLGAVFEVTPGKTYKLLASQGNVSYAFVTDKSTGVSPDLVSFADENGMTSLANGESVYLTAPGGAAYLYTSRKRSQVTVLPNLYAVELTKEHISALGSSITDLEDGVDERLDDLDERMDSKDAEIMNAKTYKVTQISPYTVPNAAAWSKYIDGNNQWHSSDGNTSGAVFRASEGQTFKIVTQDNYDQNTAYAFVQESGAGGTVDVLYATGSSRQSLGRNVTAYVTAPPLTKYLYTIKKASGNTILPTVSRVEYVNEEINNISQSIDMLPLLGLTEVEDITESLEWEDGYVSNDLVILDHSTYRHTNPISLNAGQCIIVETQAISTIIVLSEDTGQVNRAKYNVLVKGVGLPSDHDYDTYAYIAPRAMNVVISGKESATGKVLIRSKRTDFVTKIPESLYKPPVTYNILAMFDNLIAIGDSLTRGVVYTGSSSTRPAKRPYPKVLQKVCGYDNLQTWAMGGYDAREIYNDYHTSMENFIAGDTWEGNTLCIVFLGTNGGLDDGELDEVAPEGADPSEWDVTKKTGAFAWMVKKFYDHNCNMLLIKPWSVGNYDLAASQAFIDAVAERYGCAVITAINCKSNDFKYHCFPTHNGVNELHLNELGYAYFAAGIINEVSNLPDDQMKYLIPRLT